MSRTSKAVGTLAPSPLSEYLARQKLARRRQRRADGLRRRVTALRLGEAEAILRAILEGGDMLAEVTVAASAWHQEPGVALLVTMTAYDFRRLCRYGAEIEDDEDTHDAEPATGDDEASLGSRDGEIDQSHWIDGSAGFGGDEEGPEADHEPSLGSCDGIVNQERWHEGHAGDNERDDSDREPSLGSAQAMDQTAWASGGSRDLESHDEDDEPSFGTDEIEPSLGAPENHGCGFAGGFDPTDLESERLFASDPDDSCDAEAGYGDYGLPGGTP